MRRSEATSGAKREHDLLVIDFLEREKMIGIKDVTKDVKAAAVMNFVDTLIGALESGFVDKNNPTLATIHQCARNHVKTSYGHEYDDIVKRWGEDTAKLCGAENIDTRIGALDNTTKTFDVTDPRRRR